jgi:hypothetical protein
MATWKDIDWREKWQVIDRILVLAGEKVEEERTKHRDALAEKYDNNTEARFSEAGTILAIIQGMRNNLWDLEKQI